VKNHLKEGRESSTALSGRDRRGSGELLSGTLEQSINLARSEGHPAFEILQRKR